MGGRYGRLASDAQSWVVEVRGADSWRVVSCRPLHSQGEAMRYAADYTRPNYPMADIRTRQAFDAEPERKFFVRWGAAGETRKRPTTYETASEQYKRARSKFENVELVAIVPGGEKVIARGGQRHTSPAAGYNAGGTRGAERLKRSGSAKGLSTPPKGRASVSKRP
jgi:hypothetical protein